MVAIDIVHELPNPYNRLKLEIVGSCFALHPAKTRTYNDRDAYFFMAPRPSERRRKRRTDQWTAEKLVVEDDRLVSLQSRSRLRMIFRRECLTSAP